MFFARDSQYSSVRVPQNHQKSLINARLPGYMPRGSDSLAVGESEESAF